MPKFSKEFDLCLGDYNEKGVVNKNFAVMNMDFTYFMKEDELKKYSTELLPEKITYPKYLDPSKAERIYITMEEILRRVEEEQEKMKNI